MTIKYHIRQEQRSVIFMAKELYLYDTSRNKPAPKSVVILAKMIQALQNKMYQMILALQNSARSAPALAKSETEVEPETGEEEMR